MRTNYFKVAWRNLLKDRLFSFLNLIGLATGLTCALLIYLWIADEVHIGKFNEADSRLFQVMQNRETPDGIQTFENTPGLLAKALKEELPEVEYAVSIVRAGGSADEKGIFLLGDKQIEAKSLFAGNDLFKVFSYKLLQGDKSQVLSRTDAVLLSDEMAAKIFPATKNVIGNYLTWNQSGFSGLYIVTGVFKKPPANSLDQFDVIFNYDLFLQKNPKLTAWGNNDPNTYVVLKQGVNINDFDTKIVGFIKSKRPDSKSTLFIQKYSDRYLYGNYENGVVTGGRIEYVRLFSLIAIFILVIACINFMNLSTAKASRYVKTAGIKRIMGAGRIKLIAQYLGESLLMALIALLIAIVFVALLLPHFNQITGKQLTLHFDVPFILSVVAITVLTGLIAGSYPAFYISGFKPALVLKGTFTGAVGGTWVRKGLVVFQFALSAIFIVSVFVVYKQLQLVQTKNLGYSRDNIVYFEKGGLVSDNKEDYKPGGKYEKDLERLLLQVKAIPGVVNAANFRHNITNRDGGTTALTWPGKAPGTEISFTDIAAGYGFIETLGIGLKEGRTFSAQYGNEGSKVILNEAAVESIGLKNPVGTIINVWGEDKEIIGVTKNFHFESLYENVKPCFFDFTFGNRASNIMVKIKAGTEKQTLTELKKLYSKYNPGLPFEYRFLDEDYQALYASEKRVEALSKYFAALAILISCLGLFGLAAFTAQKRQKEIGIRKVVGAATGTIALMLFKDFLKLVLIAMLIAFPVSWWALSTWLQRFAYRIDIGFAVFLLAGFSILLITVITVSFQAIKAAVANPVKSLRTE